MIDVLARDMKGRNFSSLTPDLPITYQYKEKSPWPIAVVELVVEDDEYYAIYPLRKKGLWILESSRVHFPGKVWAWVGTADEVDQQVGKILREYDFLRVKIKSKRLSGQFSRVVAAALASELEL